MAPHTNGPCVNQAREDVEGVIRALLIVKKELTTLRQINSDYRDMEGEYIPFKEFGFQSLEDMLRTSGKFNLTRSNGEIIISAKLSDKDEHMAKLIRETKSKTNSKPLKKLQRKPHHTQWHQQQQANRRPPGGMNRSHRQFSRSMQNLREPQPPCRPFVPHPPPQMMHPPQCNQPFDPPMPPQWGHHQQQQQQPQFNRNPMMPMPPQGRQAGPYFDWDCRGPNNMWNGQGPPQRGQAGPDFDWDRRGPNNMWNGQGPPQRRQPEPMRFRPDPPVPQRPEFAWTPLPRGQMPRHPIVQPEIKFIQRPKSRAPPAKVVPKQEPVQPALTHHKSFPSLDLPSDFLEKLRDTPKKSLQTRLAVAPAERPPSKSEGRSIDSGLSGATRTTLSSINFVETTEPADQILARHEDPLAKLTKFCAEHKLPSPQVRCLKAGVVMGCKVTVGEKTWSKTGSSERDAKYEVVLEVLTELKLAERRKSYPVIEETNHDLALLLHELLLQYPRGVVEKNIPELFQQTTGMSLPDHWTRIVMAYSRLFTVECSALANLVYAKKLEEGELVGVEGEEDGEKDLALPWAEAHWNLYVTHVVSTTMIWARLVGEDFSDRWDEMIQEVEERVTNAQKLAESEVQVDGLFLYQKGDCWYRVRCQEVDEEAKRILGFFLDHGNVEWLPRDTLFACQGLAQRLPGQAVLFSLLGLENMEENPHAKPILSQCLAEKLVVAEVHSKVEDHVEGKGVRAVFYDTSGEEDVNLVVQLHDEICEAGKRPQLKSVGMNQVTITAVSDRGDVFCQIPGSGLEYVQKVIEKLAGNEELLARHRGLREEELQTGEDAVRYLVFDRPRGKWYRAVLKVRHPQSGDHLMHCLDTGCQLNVVEQDIYHLRPLSKALDKYPPLVILCRLHNVTKLEPKIIARMRDLLQPNTVALAKVLLIPVADRNPQVNLYLRMEPSRVIVCVNDTLRMEGDFESSFAN